MELLASHLPYVPHEPGLADWIDAHAARVSLSVVAGYAVVLLLVVWMVWRARRRRREAHRARARLCMKCGYPVRGLSGTRCPECATVVWVDMEGRESATQEGGSGEHRSGRDGDGPAGDAAPGGNERRGADAGRGERTI